MTRLPVAVALGVLLGLGVLAGALAWVLPGPGGEPPPPLVRAITMVGMVVLGATLLRVVRPDGRRPLGAGSARFLLYLAVGACIVQVVRFSPFEPGTFAAVLHVALALGAAVLLLGGADRFRAPRALAVADLVAGVLVVMLVGAEVGLRIVAAVAPSPLLAARDLLPEQRVACFRYRPGTVVDGTPANEAGFPAPPFERGDAARVVALLSDRTLGGGLPHPVGPAAVAEDRLGDAAVWHFALRGLSTPELGWLLEHEVLPRGPDVAIAVVDLGDDLVELDRDRSAWRPLALWLDRANARVPLAIARAADAARRRAELGDAADAARRAPAVADEDAIATHFPWIGAPDLEPPRGTDAELVTEAVRTHALLHGPRADRLVRRAVDDLAAMAERCAAHGVAFGVVLLPARAAIDPALRDAVGAERDDGRSGPRAALRQRLTAHAIRHTDLTPVLGTARPGADGRGHLFHRGSTDLNARGARLCGEAIASFAAELLQRTEGR